jgi:hypothetical protein
MARSHFVMFDIDGSRVIRRSARIFGRSSGARHLRHASAVSVRFGVEVAAHARMLPMLVFTVANIVCPAVILAQVVSHRFFRA